jgi:hydrogenase expression/formation protein HypE
MAASQKRITLAHGNGGRLMHELVERLRIKFSNRILNEMTDAAELELKGKRIAFSTDSFVVKPLFFPGGDIGQLAVYGTVNDLAMKGARPLFLSLAFILEEGLAFSVLDRVAQSIKLAAQRAKVQIVTGDIKVVEKGAADQLFIITSGIGVIENPETDITAQAKKGDVIIINGPIAQHGLAIFEAREHLGFHSRIKTDCAPLNQVVERCLSVSQRIHVLRDPTRGGIATSLNEIARTSRLGIEIDSCTIPVRRDVKTMCDILGFDPLYIANEGKFLCFVDHVDAAKVSRAMGKASRIIGRVVNQHRGEVYLKTETGVMRLLGMLEADQLPRIC